MVTFPPMSGLMGVFSGRGGGKVAKSFKLRTEIILHITLLLGAALLFGGMLMLKMTERELLSQRVDSLTVATETIGNALGDIMAPEQNIDILRPRVVRLLQLLPAGTESNVWSFFGNAFHPIYLHDTDVSSKFSTSRLTSFRYLREPEAELSYPGVWLGRGDFESRYFRLSMPLVHRGEFVGVFQTRFPLDGVGQRVLASFKVLILYVVIYGVVLFVFGLYQLNRNVVRPIGALTASTLQVTDGNLDGRVAETGPSEIASLAHSFNVMVEALRESRQSADQYILSLQQANEKLKRTSDELIRSEKMASVGHLAAGMAHEIGNPLAAVVGYLGLLKEELPEGRQRDMVDFAGMELDRIDRLVRELLDYAKPGSELEEIFDPIVIARDALTLLRRQGAFDTIAVEDDLPACLPCVKMVPQRLMQVFVNLLINARDASPVEGKIRVRGGEDESTVWFSVADEGQGICEEHLPHIFDPFFTTKAPGKGRGLGLAVCHRVVKEAGGTITVQSAAGQGSLFEMRLKKEAGRDAC